MIEIEQKFCYKYIPFLELELIHHTVIHRQYLSVNPEIRLNRRVFDDGKERFHLTVKNVELLARKETKIEITPEQYSRLAQTSSQEAMIFDVWTFRLESDRIITFKVGKNVEFNIAEIEYRNFDDYLLSKNNWRKWDFLIEDVTFNEEFYIRNIWRNYCCEKQHCTG